MIKYSQSYPLALWPPEHTSPCKGYFSNIASKNSGWAPRTFVEEFRRRRSITNTHVPGVPRQDGKYEDVEEQHPEDVVERESVLAPPRGDRSHPLQKHQDVSCLATRT